MPQLWFNFICLTSISQYICKDIQECSCIQEYVHIYGHNKIKYIKIQSKLKTYVIEIFEIKTQEGYYLKQIGSNNNKNDNDNSDNDNNSY